MFSLLRLTGSALVLTLTISAQDLWSFEPRRSAAVPDRSPADGAIWSDHPVDRFLRASQRRQGLEPVGDASTLELLRRVTFVLTGLPPTASQRDRLQQVGFEAFVDELLESEGYAERFGRHWLDVARFAESSGGGRSLMYPHAWRYRDYVIDSYRRDVPFDQFVLEQLAGDLLPADTDEQANRQITATGFLCLGPHNYEQQDKERLRLDVIDEQVDTTGRAFLGMTIGCARCHDHPFDPVSARDYYAMAGIFGSTDLLRPGNVSGYRLDTLRGPAARRVAQHAARVAELKQQIAGLPKVEVMPARGDIVLDDTDARLTGSWKASTSVKGFLGDGYVHDQNADKQDKRAEFEFEVEAAGEYEVRLAYTAGINRASNVAVVVYAADGESTRTVNQKKAPKGGAVSLGKYRFATRGRVVVRAASTDGYVIVDGLQVLSGSPDESERSQLESELEQLKKSAPPKAPVAMCVGDLTKPADMNVRIRGGLREFGELVPRGGLAALGGSFDVPADRSGRLELARWIIRDDHPLTARVYVNRIWQHVFGVGLVRTSDNFGAMGEEPSHPELLDWLADWFVAEGQSTRSLVRLLVTSRSWRQAARVVQHAEDPRNRLLASRSRQRLDAEAIRDAVLQISGELDRTVGGATIRKLKQYDYDYVFDTVRRSVYVPRFRNAALDLFDVFDCANSNVSTARRNVSNVPSQSLFLMNSDWIRARARKAALRLIAEGPDLDRACLWCLGRTPRPDERDVLGRCLESHDPETAWTDVFHVLFASIDFRYLD